MKPSLASLPSLWFAEPDLRVLEVAPGQACAVEGLPADESLGVRDLARTAAQGHDEWIDQRPKFSPFLDAERAAQIAKLESFRTLQQGWDSYDAEPPSEKAIANARHVLHVIWSIGHASPIRTLSPSVEGGVGIVFEGSSQKYADIECFNGGEILAITSEGTNDPSVWPVEETGSLPRAIERINTFLNG